MSLAIKQLETLGQGVVTAVSSTISVDWVTVSPIDMVDRGTAVGDSMAMKMTEGTHPGFH